MLNLNVLKHEMSLGILMLREELSREMRLVAPSVQRLVQIRERLHVAEVEFLKVETEELRALLVQRGA